MTGAPYTGIATVITGAKTPAHKIAARDAAIAASQRARQLRKLSKLTAAPSKPGKSQSLPLADADTSYHQQAFDGGGYAAFLRQWAEELETLGEIERERLEARVMPYFAGAVMGDEWRAIISALRGIRNANARSEPVPRVSHADERPVSRGW